MLTLKSERVKYYLIKDGETFESIARAANVSETALRKKNGGGEALKGRLLLLPPCGNLYTVKAGDDVVTLCGCRERVEELNGTDVLCPGMKIRI